MTHGYTEDELVEQPAIELFAELGWQTVNAFHETFGEHGTLGRENAGEVVLLPRLRAALRALNPSLPAEALEQAAEELTRSRSALSPAAANREIYQLLKDGVKVTFRDDEGEEVEETVRLIDWRAPENNDFLLVSQLWVTGAIYTRRADLVGFVNGLPLLFVELKASHKQVKDAYSKNLRDYKHAIPQLFWYNALILLSNGSDSRVGSLTASWEHFAEWKKISDEDEPGVISLETVIRGTCEKARFLDLVENFTLFSEERGELVKLLAKNHQYLGVNNAIRAVREIRENQGRLGVFWHTQGSGKSYSMVFFSQKVLRTLPGNWTFLVVTDRKELDEQIYGAFAKTGVVTEGEEQVRAASGEDLKEKLAENHRFLFTLIQKFHTAPGTRYPTVSERSDVIVMTDEAHRTQYDVLALNMRNALPNAAFLGFTGTPLMAGEEKTREVFGDYVSVYNFRDSVEDGATVPLYFENRKPELHITNEYLGEDLQRLLEEAELDERAEKRVEREFAREYHLITRDDRLEKVAEDVVEHFIGRGFQGKAMVISIDKLTAVKMYEKVRQYWARMIERLERERDAVEGEEHRAEKQALEEKIRFMRQTDMAVVVSQGQNEVEDFAEHGLDILPHRKRMLSEDLESRFKDPDDPFRLVFVCAMWLTGFDAPACSTLYLDKPMKNHTLMQTIARANRVHREKNNGLIVAYLDIFKELEKALAIYGTASGGGVKPGDTPVEEKQALVEALETALQAARAFCARTGVDLPGILRARGFERVGLLDDAVEKIVGSEERKKEFLAHADLVARLFKAILPDARANDFAPERAALVHLAEKVRSLDPTVDISAFMREVQLLLDESIAADSYEIHAGQGGPYGQPRVDLSKIDFEKLRKSFQEGRKKIEAERLKGLLKVKVAQMVQQNKSRADLLEKLQEMISSYNAGSMNVELFFDKLLAFTQQLTEEEQRGMREQLSEEELAVFDLLTQPEPALSEKERAEVKKVARELLETLKAGKLVLEWRKRQQTRADVRVTVEKVLDRLPRSYSVELYRKKCDSVYQHIYDSYWGPGPKENSYGRAA
ncbi:MAG TPA: type I restriction endonuclease subunit R [Longimicrobiaceae bacterium]|nr:type I restriction endonuclease subunit R [Longimicrobiaceae bacterium]